jgi:L-aminopeptidase/D-esterase-like protein
MNHLPEGFLLGHWTDRVAATGCTVILCPEKTVGGCDVRGSSPGSREIALLAPDKTMHEVHAVLLTGGSAFGLAAADGVMRFLEERGVGYQTPWAKVPIVPAAVIYDLNIGVSNIRPESSAGYEACSNARKENIGQGSVGAGTGATIGKWGGLDTRMKGGLGIASMTSGELVVSAVAVVNAVGDVLTGDGSVLAGAKSTDAGWLADADPHRTISRGKVVPLSNTTLVVIVTNARMSKVEVNRVAQRGHDGMARVIKPVHTSFDGDIVFALASGNIDASFESVASLGADLTEEAIRSGVSNATSLAGVVALRDL